ncbi:unnamed protein product, partial [Candidula unifasciata]
MADRESAHIQVGILTVSDSCFNGTAIDRSGESLKQLVESGKFISATVVTKDILPDEYDQIKAKLLHWSDNLKLDLILTTGGTGFSLRDVTPEATKAVLEREALGMTVAMLKGSLEITPLAMLTRLTCGTRGRTLIINLPGSTKGSAECFEIASKGIPHAVDLLRGHKQSVEKTHITLQSEGIRSAHGSHHHQHSGDHGHKLTGHCGHSKSVDSGHHQPSADGSNLTPHPHPPSDGDRGHSCHQRHHHGHVHSHVNAGQVAMRPRKSPYPIITVEEALALVLENTHVLPTEDVCFKDALGRYLATSVYAADPLPPFP